MRQRLPAVLVVGLCACACAVDSPLAPTTTPKALAAPTPSPAAAPTFVAPDGWDILADDELGFAVAYPSGAVLTPGEGESRARISFPPDAATNVVEEILTLYGAVGAGPCSSPMAAGWGAVELTPETVVLNGISFLRQSHSGVAAGTSSVWVAYTTEREGRCVSLGYELRTFDPANLDPTRFPAPPATVDRRERVHSFEAIVATFVWTR
jgi:hypothetical protein